MNKRTALKSLAFIVGLYFVLEFLLPVKIGGEFDSFEVGSPAPVRSGGESLLFYVGEYEPGVDAVGRMVADATSSNGWRKSPVKPVMQRSLFVPHDREGMDQLDAVAVGRELYLLYIGLNPEKEATLCYAVSADNGVSWKKLGPVLVGTNGAPVPSLDAPNGQLPGKLEFFAAEYESGAWLLYLVLNTTARGRCVWRATGAELNSLRLSPEPVVSTKYLPFSLTAFDARRIKEGEIITFVNKTSPVSVAVEGDAITPFDPPALPTNRGEIVSLRVDAHNGTLFFGTMKMRDKELPVEFSQVVTELFAMPSGDAARVIKSVGRQGMPTYLSRGTSWAGQFMQIVGAFAIFIAMINLIIFHGKKLVQRRKGSYNSIVFLACLVAMTMFALLGTPTDAEGTIWRSGYDFLFNSINLPMGAAVFSMITFYLISAAYRSFRIRSIEAALLMLSAVIVMVGQMPVGEWLAILIPEKLYMLKPPWLAQKLLTVINAAAYRGVLIGMLVGGLAISLRIWLGIDDSVYSGLEEKE